MNYTSKAFIIKVKKVSSRGHAVVMLTQEHGQIAGLLNSTHPPVVTAFGVAQWTNRGGNIYIQFEQTAPSLILGLLNTTDTDSIIKLVSQLESVENFYELCEIIRDFLPEDELKTSSLGEIRAIQ